MRSYTSTMPGLIANRSRYFWLSLALGVLVALVALPSFTDPWPSNAGGVVFIVIVVTAAVRGFILLGQAFQQGWREPKRPVSR